MTKKEQRLPCEAKTALGLLYMHRECTLCHFSSCESWGDLVILCFEADVIYIIAGVGEGGEGEGEG